MFDHPTLHACGAAGAQSDSIDVGRPIRHIESNITSLSDEPIAEVIETMVSYEREVRDLDGRSLLDLRELQAAEAERVGLAQAEREARAGNDAKALAALAPTA